MIAAAMITSLIVIIAACIAALGGDIERTRIERRAARRCRIIRESAATHMTCARDYAVMSADAYRRGDPAAGDRHHEMVLNHINHAMKETP